MDRRFVLFGAGGEGEKALERLGRENVAFFIDNNAGKIKEKAGVEVKTPEEAFREIGKYSLLISVSAPYREEIKAQLREAGIGDYALAGEYLRKRLCDPARIREFRDRYAGRRCFLIGTGPSLKVRDLEMLRERGEICFGANKIFKIFPRTEWRPELYCATDRRILTFYQEEIGGLELPNMFVACHENSALRAFMRKLSLKENVRLFTLRDSAGEGQVEFSEEPSGYVVEGRTVIYAMMQLAAYMGFAEIDLLGVDFDYTDPTGYDRNGSDHFCKDYVAKGEEVLVSAQDYCLRAFESARRYAEEKGIRIYNATRGGKLEVFERIDLDRM